MKMKKTCKNKADKISAYTYCKAILLFAITLLTIKCAFKEPQQNIGQTPSHDLTKENASVSSILDTLEVIYSESSQDKRSLDASVEGMQVRQAIVVPIPIPKEITVKFTLTHLSGAKLSAGARGSFSSEWRNLATEIKAFEHLQDKTLIELKILNLSDLIGFQYNFATVLIFDLATELDSKRIFVSLRTTPHPLSVTELPIDSSKDLTVRLGQDAVATPLRRYEIKNTTPWDYVTAIPHQISGSLYTSLQNITHSQITPCKGETLTDSFRAPKDARFLLVSDEIQNSQF